MIKSWSHKIPTRKNFGQRNTHQKILCTNEILTRKKLRPTKYPREKFSDLRRDEGTMALDPRDPRNLAHSYFLGNINIGSIIKKNDLESR